MASITRDPGGRKRIQFVAPGGSRKAVRLGKISEKAALAVKVKIEAIVSALNQSVPVDDETARWLRQIDNRMASKLIRVGLMAKLRPAPTKLDDFLAGYLATRTDIKPSTRRHLEQAREKLITFFGAEKPLAAVTPGDADEFRLSLLQRLGDNTVRRMCGRAKQLFRAAQRKRLISENPFGDMKGCGVQPNRARDYFITRDEAQHVLDACPDAEWRLLFALARFGGVRVPSEALALRWGDVDWDRNRLRIPSPKTERLPGRASRIIPLFAELRPHLDAAFEQAKSGTEFVISRYRGPNANLRTQLERIIERAGLQPWPKLFQNCRASRETELAETFPLHVAAEWIGNSQAVAARHYLQVTDEHFQQAVTFHSGKAAQKAAQQTDAAHRREPSVVVPAQQETPTNRGIATLRDEPRSAKVPPLGLEPRTY
jgi:integrase